MNNIDSSILIQRVWRGFSDRKRSVIRILNNVDWSLLLDLYKVFGESLNSNDMKPMKGKLYEIFVAKCNSNFIHVDQNGYDLLCLGIRIESKFTQNLLLTDKGRGIKKNITFRYKNSNGSNIMSLSLLNTAGIYILIQRDAIGWVDGYDVKNNVQGTGDLDARIPGNLIHLLWKNDTNIMVQENPLFDLPYMINHIYSCICEALWMNMNWKEELKNCLYRIADSL